MGPRRRRARRRPSGHGEQDAAAAPVHAGDPGYGRHLDRDGDGTGCE
ncbi:excalibur calcium-binding domain-containing protein [Streptomyces bobili]